MGRSCQGDPAELENAGSLHVLSVTLMVIFVIDLFYSVGDTIQMFTFVRRAQPLAGLLTPLALGIQLCAVLFSCR
jgi:hypothetical protein